MDSSYRVILILNIAHKPKTYKQRYPDTKDLLQFHKTGALDILQAAAAAAAATAAAPAAAPAATAAADQYQFQSFLNILVRCSHVS